jgi:hypothetical protein
MGCKNTKEPSSSFMGHKELLKKQIENDLVQIPVSDQASISLIINDELALVNSIKLNALGYALYLGKFKSFRYIHEILKASISEMESMLHRQAVSPLTLSVFSGNLDLFIYYFKFHSNDQDQDLRNSEYLINKHKSISSLPLIQQAVLSGSVNIVGHLNKSAENLKQANFSPGYFDVHYINEDTGENSALVACRSGKYVMQKLVFNLGGNFLIKNKKQQNAIQVLAEEDLKDGRDTFECLCFLVFEVRIEFRYCYEECLINFRDPRAIQLIEKELEKLGIYVTKCEIEDIYSGKGRMNQEYKTPESGVMSFLSLSSQASILGSSTRTDNV